MATSPIASHFLQTIYFISFIFLIFGMQSAAKAFSFVLGSRKQLLSNSRNWASEGLFLLAGVLGFCLLSNTLLLLPSLLELCLRLDSKTAYLLHTFAIQSLSVILLLLVSTGLVSIIPCRSPKCSDLIISKTLSLFLDRIPKPTKLTRNIILTIASVYIATAQYFAGINYDTALYHLPAVAHFLKYGPELGLANLHFSLGFYNLPLFGQAVLQGFSPTDQILSPSLNIVFLCVFISIVIGGMIDPGSKTFADSSKLFFRKLIFLIASLLFGGIEIGSLSSYNADFALTCTTLALIYICFFAADPPTRKAAFGFGLMLPILKLSGVLGLIFICVYELLTLCLGNTSPLNLTQLSYNLQKTILKWQVMKKNLSPAILIIVSYVIMFLTYLVLSGYVVFPQVSTGPIFEHAVPVEIAKYVKGSLVSFYARTNDNGVLANLAYAQNWGPRQWIPIFLQTERGLLMTGWIGLALMTSGLSMTQLLVKNRRMSGHLFAMAITMPIITTLAMFILPPNPRFFPWIGSLLIMQYGELLLLYPAMAMAGLILLVNLLSLRLNRPILKSVGEVPVKNIVVPRSKINGWKPRAKDNSFKSDSIIIRKPPADKCWATERPCTPYFWFLKQGNSQSGEKFKP
jgi:hypothetical protein